MIRTAPFLSASVTPAGLPDALPLPPSSRRTRRLRHRAIAGAVCALAVIVSVAAPAAADDPRDAAIPSTGSRNAAGAAQASGACLASGAPATLAQVFERVRSSPRAEAALGELAAFDGLVEQAGARPNPTLGIEVEDFTGSGAYRALGQTQSTLSLEQRIELGGVRGRRIDVATRERDAAGARGLLERVQVELEAKQRYVELIASRQRRAVAADGERLARETLAGAERLVAAGAGSAADAERARIAIAAATLQVAEHDRDAAAAAQRLASLWGGDEREAACVVALLPAATILPSPAGPVMAGTGNRAAPQSVPAAVLVAEADVETRRAEIEAARASAAPDLEVGAGIRHLAGPDEVSAVAGVRIEVPIFDRNAGAIAAAQQKLIAAQARAKAVRTEAEARRARLHSALVASAGRADALRREMIPPAERAYGLLAQAWRSGAASSLDVLEARRTLIELRLQHIDALAEYSRWMAALEAAGGSLAPTLSASVSADAAGVQPAPAVPAPGPAPARNKAKD